MPAYILTRIKKAGVKMEIKKGNINLCEQIARSYASALVEGDIVIPDTKPDIAEILLADAKAKVTDTDYKGGVLKIAGQVEFMALYKPEDGGELVCVSESLYFGESIDIKGSENASFTVKADVEHIGFTLVNSRKLSAKMMIALSAVANDKMQYEPVIEVTGEDIESRSKKHSIYIPVSDTETKISVSDILTVAEDCPDIGEILKVDAWVSGIDTRVMNGKVMIHADMHVNTMYASAEDEKVTGVSHTVPFTEIVEAPGADEQTTVNVTCNVMDVFATTKGDLKGDTKIISVDASICARVRVSKTMAETVVDDCYCLSGKTEVSRDSMKISEYITSENARITVNKSVDVPKNVKIDEVIHCCAKPLLRAYTWENGMVKVSGVLVAFLVYRDGDGNLRCGVSESDINWEKAIHDKCEPEVDMWLEDISADNGNIIANVGLYMKALKSHRVDILTDVNKKDEESQSDIPCMVIYFVKEGDTLWSIAKKYRTKAEKIKIANKLENDKIEVGRRLMIPKA